MAEGDVFVDDSLPFDLTQPVSENLKTMKARFIKDGMNEKRATELIEDIRKRIEAKIIEGAP
jgi:antitoxin component of RelBE/YafQ-DinJ toxin-antitoxin module